MFLCDAVLIRFALIYSKFSRYPPPTTTTPRAPERGEEVTNGQEF